MAHKIFQTPPLGEMSNMAALTAEAAKKSRASSAKSKSLLSPAKTSRKRAKPRISDIPVAPAYRVEPLARVSPSDGKWRTQAMRSHRTPTLLWFTKGQGRITVAGVTRGFGPHNLLFLPEKTMYGFEPIGQVYGSIVHLPNTPAFAFPEEPLHMRFREAVQQNEITGLIENLQLEIDGEQPARDKALDLHAGMIAVWLERQTRLMPDYDLTPDASRRLVAAYTSLVETEFRQDHSVAHYARELGVTPTHLTRACNVACGRPASVILADRVHFEARRMLRETDLSVAAIAGKLGFHSPAYFSRSFRKEVGLSPRDFRKN